LPGGARPLQAALLGRVDADRLCRQRRTGPHPRLAVAAIQPAPRRNSQAFPPGRPALVSRDPNVAAGQQSLPAVSALVAAQLEYVGAGWLARCTMAYCCRVGGVLSVLSVAVAEPGDGIHRALQLSPTTVHELVRRWVAALLAKFASGKSCIVALEIPGVVHRVRGLRHVFTVKWQSGVAAARPGGAVA